MRMRYSRTKSLRRNAPSQSINLKLCRFATLGDGKTCTPRVKNITETAITKLFGRSPSRHPHVRRRPHCEHSACAEHYRNGDYETLRTVVDAFQTTLAPPTSTRLHTYAVDRIANTTTSRRKANVSLGNATQKFIGNKNKDRSSCGFGMVFSACQFARCISYSCYSYPTL